ncbi:type VI secretion system tip protein VgrG [Escherichia fergusonii]|uniref:type VI secretion system Vgr family protein n=1 Tax=Escherichia fergusonii TaxID=564 RepID=UPI002FD05FBA
MPEGTRFTLEASGLPPDTFAVVTFHLSQSLSSLFTLDVTAVSHDPAIDFSAIIDEDVTLTIWQGDSPQRRVKGLVTWFEQGDTGKHQTQYRMRIRPPFWRSSLRQNCRSFQNLDIRTILFTLLREMDVLYYDVLFALPHPPREFCVQFMETDFDFARRLMAEEGIYFFEEEDLQAATQKLIMADKAGYQQSALSLPYNPNGDVTPEFCIRSFRRSTQIRPAKVVSRDYTFTAPNWRGQFERRGDNMPFQRPDYEIFDYPGRFKDEQHGAGFTRYQLEGLRNNAECADGSSNSPQLWPGMRFTLSAHPREDLNVLWQVVESELHGEQPQAQVGHGGSGTTLVNDFTVIPGHQTWRPVPEPKPLIDGPQTAVVTGPPGEEIFCDEHGRVRVKFTWDRYNAADQDSSCWVRVSQAWGGTGFGNLAIPRVGQEVIVDFLNGDPDQPIIMGRTYHQDNRSPGSLPGTKTQMAIRSKTYKGSGYNELMFEDRTGQELLSMHAQKDMKTVVLNDQSSNINHDQSLVVGNNRLKVIVANEDTKIDGHQTVSIRQFQNVSVKSDVTNFNGGERIMQSVGSVVIGSGTMIRLECGKSALELHAGGVINLKGTAFNIVSDSNSLITTGKGILGLNPGGDAPEIGVPGDSHKNELTKIINGIFPEDQGGGK